MGKEFLVLDFRIITFTFTCKSYSSKINIRIFKLYITYIAEAYLSFYK